MGGRGGASGLTRVRRMPQPQTMIPPNQPPQQQPQQTGPIQNQVPDANNTPVTPDAITQLQGMSDAQLAQAYLNSQNVKLPNHLNDANDKTQKFVFSIGLNDKPLVLDQAAFQQYLQQNNIPQNQILSRSVNQGQLVTSAGNKTNLTAQQVVDMLKNSRLTYIGGKHGGQKLGAGAYLDMNGGGNTLYGGTTLTGVLNPQTAKIITKSKLDSMARAFDRSHPQFARATGGYQNSGSSWTNNNMSIYALAMGYNVVKDDHGGYHNVIDRKALVLVK